jgi:uncharacterized integral membrane protein
MPARTVVRWWERLLIWGIALTPVVLLTRDGPRFSWKTILAVGAAAVTAALFTVLLDTRRRIRTLREQIRSRANR